MAGDHAGGLAVGVGRHPGGGERHLHAPALQAALAAAAGARLEVEIGCGNGIFLADYAAARPDRVCVGIDLKQRRCEKAQRKLQRRGLSNAFVINGRAEEVIDRLPPGSVHAFHLYFPDPWPKARHRRRRLLRGGVLDRMVNALAAGGRILFATDFLDYHVQARVLFACHPALQLDDAAAPRGADRSTFAVRLAGVGAGMRVACAYKRPC